MNDFLQSSHALRNQLEYALKACGLPISVTPEQIRPLQQDTQGYTYAVRPVANKRGFIVRLHPSPLPDKTALHAHYMAQSLYYRLAHHVHDAVCPSIYHYYVNSDMACSIESELVAVPQHHMSAKDWHQMGHMLGTFIGQMNQKSAHLKGMGTLSWNGAKLFGVDSLVNLRLIDRTPYDQALEIILSAYPHHKTLLSQTLEVILPLRSVEEAVILVNGDGGSVFPQVFSPAQMGVGIHAVKPLLGNGHHYAAQLVYTLLHEAHPHVDTLVHGFISSYPDKLLLLAELWLWLLLALAQDNHDEQARRHHESPKLGHLLNVSLDIHRALW
ncbi:MAG: hypothetical protein ACOYLB_04565 [Phototrophicaceae bacterium]